MKPNRNKPVPPGRPDPEQEHWEEECKWRNRMGQIAHELGHQFPSSGAKHGVEDAVAHLMQLPLAHALAKAKEWTGRTDLTTLEEAISAVREAGKE